MMIIHYSQSSEFKLTDEEFKKAIPAFNSGKNVWVERLKVHLSPYYKWAGEKPQDNKKRTLRDGTIAINEFGTWKCQTSGAKIDLRYYPELAKDLNDEDVKKLAN